VPIAAGSALGTVPAVNNDTNGFIAVHDPLDFWQDLLGEISSRWPQCSFVLDGADRLWWEDGPSAAAIAAVASSLGVVVDQITTSYATLDALPAPGRLVGEATAPSSSRRVAACGDPLCGDPSCRTLACCRTISLNAQARAAVAFAVMAGYELGARRADIDGWERYWDWCESGGPPMYESGDSFADLDVLADRLTAAVAVSGCSPVEILEDLGLEELQEVVRLETAGRSIAPPTSRRAHVRSKRRGRAPRHPAAPGKPA